MRSSRRCLTWFLGIVCALALGGAVRPARAQQGPPTDEQLDSFEQRAPAGAGNEGADTHLFRPAVDSKGFLSTNGSDILGHNDISFGLILDYGRNLMRTGSSAVPLTEFDRTPDPSFPGEMVETVTAIDECRPDDCIPSEAGADPNDLGTGTDALVKNSFQGTFSFNYGIKNIAVIGLNMPVILMTGDEAFGIGPNENRYNSERLDAQKISSLALHAKFRITRVEKGPGLALLIQGGFPVADSPQDLGGDPGAWFWPQAILEQRFGRLGRFKMGVNAGFRLHTGPNARFETGYGDQPQLAEGNFEYGNLATYQFGVAWRAIDSLDLVAESYGSYLVGTDSDSGQTFSNEFLGGIKLFVERNSYLTAGGGARVFATGFQAADLRAVLGFVFEPSIGDRDGDGYKDDEDECPDEPEDFDGFKDEDGCPDPDNDNDGILDVDDRCPNTPEDPDGDEDEDGCPEGEQGDRDGDGILDKDDECPDDPEDRDGFEDKDGCPEPDNDQDGILDVDDQCPLDPEDKDNFEDEDGCPDPDNDRDQILDVEDDCPNDPETYNGHEDEDGCPDKGKVVIEGSDIMILEKIHFETGSAEIRPESTPILDAVATTLQHHPEFRVIEIAGHADERASDQYNLRLTKDRARSVVEALVERGISRDRLVSQGYGEFCPLKEASTPEAWEKNRRVEFKVVKTEDGRTGVDRGCQRARSEGVLPPQVR